MPDKSFQKAPGLLPAVYTVQSTKDPPLEARGKSNPYLEAMFSDGLLGDSRHLHDSNLSPELEGNGLPIGSPQQRESIRRFGNRNQLRRYYSWAIPNQEALQALASYQPLLELGAGGGYWAYLLRRQSVDIIACDLNPPPPSGRAKGWSHKLWTEVMKAEPSEMLQAHPLRTLMLCWPSPGHSRNCWAAAALQAYRGQSFIYIGEEAGRATGSLSFHNYLAENFELERQISIPRWSFLQDRLQFWSRK